MDINTINNDTKNMCIKTLQVLNEDKEKIENTDKYLNNTISNINISKKILENINSLNKRIFNYLLNEPQNNKKEIHINQEKQTKPVDTNDDNIYQQVLEIKNFNLLINNELKDQNNKLTEIISKSNYIQEEMNQTSKLFN